MRRCSREYAIYCFSGERVSSRISALCHAINNIVFKKCLGIRTINS